MLALKKSEWVDGLAPVGGDQGVDFCHIGNRGVIYPNSRYRNSIPQQFSKLPHGRSSFVGLIEALKGQFSVNFRPIQLWTKLGIKGTRIIIK